VHVRSSGCVVVQSQDSDGRMYRQFDDGVLDVVCDHLLGRQLQARLARVEQRPKYALYTSCQTPQRRANGG
jgi:PleD family two-component response regulator